VIGQLTQLQSLVVYSNQLTTVPDAIGLLTSSFADLRTHRERPGG
jgi:Leucine-rich repeat (LRR) protein